ncbi:hypothetical protein C9374_004803 [Naegleria lovaniensis]|uniref:G8 domain-containing protein n=1 Tax=Naegleria lovaniensis TaxID=51637 RepID=A0AA88KNQ1_NAELO|nr:uncharacterized protein C9374_004803 [Naegleria lovaniensis]KAG2382836.1 hypothetical protein C9374_004803 [Naegleria lovaniensis]
MTLQALSQPSTRPSLLQVVGIVVAFLCMFSWMHAASACPWDQVGLTPFTSLEGSTQANGTVYVNTPTLISSSTPILRAIIVRTGGSLIFDTKAMNVSVNYIRVESGGSFILGSNSCPMFKKIIFTFYGSETNANEIGVDPYDNSPLGSKGIAFLTGSVVQIVSNVPGKSSTWTQLGQTAFKGSRNIILNYGVKWQVGNSIVIASTDYGEVLDMRTDPPPSPDLDWQTGVPFPDQSEKFTISAISADGKNITLDKPLAFIHWGEGRARAEVGLLTRNVVFQGDATSEQSEFGGHFIVRLVNKMQIIGAEFVNMGQKGHMGRYPIHTHLLRSSSSAISDNFVIANNSIHNSFQRCLSIHNSYNIAVTSNVCFNFWGHGYFLEDGSEIGNEFKYNLGIRSKAIIEKQIIPSDKDPSVFWITNPNNTFIGNAAVGGKWGYVYFMPTNPTGLSSRMAPENTTLPRIAPMGAFDDNIAHSADSGLWVEEQMLPDGTSEIEGYYPATWNGSVLISNRGIATFRNFTGYKNRNYGAWVKGAIIQLLDFYVFDNRVQLTAPTGPTVTVNAVMIGETSNTGDSSFRPNVDLGGRSRPDLYRKGGVSVQIIGYEQYEDAGPQYVMNSTFINLVSDQVRMAGAFSSRKTRQVQSTQSKNINLTFINANKHYINPNSIYDDHRFLVYADLDGSSTGFPHGGWVVGSDTIIPFNGCIFNSSWNSYSCPAFGESYGQLRFTNAEYDTFDVTDRNRVQHPELRDPNIRQTQQYTWDLLRNIASPVTGSIAKTANTYLNQANVILRGFYTIRMPYDIPTPKSVRLSLNKVVNGDWVVVTLPYRKDASFNVQYAESQSSPSSQMNPGTLSQMMQYPRQYYYWDVNGEMLYIKLQQLDGRDSFETIYNTFTSYSSGGIVSITATCPSGTCAPITLQNPVNAKSIYKTYMREDRYVGLLETCQQNVVVPGSYTPGYGKVYAFLDPNSKVLDVTVYHNLNFIVTGITVGIGAPGVETRQIYSSYSAPHHSISRFLVDFSYSEWIALIKGQVFVKVSTTAHPQGHLRAQLYCSTGSTCTIPPPISSATPSNTGVGQVLLNLYSGSFAGYSIKTALDTTYDDKFVDSSMDGNALKVTMQTGNITVAVSNDVVVSQTNSTGAVNYLEFYVRSLDSNIPLLLTVTAGYSKKNYNPEVVGRLDVLHYKIDTTIATRVRLAVSDLALVAGAKFNSVTFELTDKSLRRTFVLDQIRFVNGDKAPVSSGVTPSQIVYFNTAPKCGSTVDPDPDPFSIRNL